MNVFSVIETGIRIRIENISSRANQANIACQAEAITASGGSGKKILLNGFMKLDDGSILNYTYYQIVTSCT